MNWRQRRWPRSAKRIREREAAKWVALHDRGLSDEEEREFQAWLESDPENSQRFFEYEVVWTGLEPLADWTPASDKAPNPDLFADFQRERWIRGAGWVVAAMLVISVVGTLLFRSQVPSNGPEQPSSFERVFASTDYLHAVLDDGTTLELDKDSRAEVRFTGTTRTVHLLKGQLHCSVKKDHVRPFVVSAGDAVVVAVGTAFSVKLDSRKVDVLVTEGNVVMADRTAFKALIADEKSPSATLPKLGTEVLAGFAATRDFAEENSQPEVVLLNEWEISEKLSWKERTIDMQSARLADIADRFNEMNDVQILVKGDALRDMRYSVAMNPGSYEEFVELLRLTMQVRVDRSNQGLIIIEAD